MENKTVALFGGESITVTYHDGKTEEVKVRVLSVKEFPILVGILEDELQMAELFCAKPKDWAETLTIGSLDAVIVKGESLNDDFFSRWARRRLARQEKLLPGVTERLVSLSRNGSQK